MTQYIPGKTLAYFETSRDGLVPVRIMGMSHDEDWAACIKAGQVADIPLPFPGGAKVCVVVTGRKHHIYKVGEVIFTDALHVIPRDCVRWGSVKRGRGATILPHKWERVSQ